MAEAKIVLSLSMKEAGVLLKILDNVGGNPLGPRGEADSIRYALIGVGIVPTGELESCVGYKGLPALYFNDRW